MVKIITLSRGKEKNVKTIEATFQVDGELVPLKVSERDQSENYREIDCLLESPNLDFEEVTQDIYNLMSPEARVKQSINDSYYLSESLSISAGRIYFNDELLENTLANHMLSLLNEDNVPKDEKLWRSYIKFLDNLHQNANEDIREQLFRWMDYENKAGNAFAISDDGCLIGYKGCIGTVIEPMSRFEGNAIVDGEEYTGQIPNKVGSVIQMPRSAVQCDPAIGCSFGLHVGTRDYAVSWAPVLILVKVNPRDVVSVPYECQSQKMRVCEYTVMKVTDTHAEHQMYYSSDNDDDESDYIVDTDEAYELLGSDVYVEFGDDSFEGNVADVYCDGLTFMVVEDESGNIRNISLMDITHLDYGDLDDDIELEMSVEDAQDLLDDGSTIFIERDDGSEYEGLVIDVFTQQGKEPGVIIRSDAEGYKHIKLNRIDDWVIVDDDDDESENEGGDVRLNELVCEIIDLMRIDCEEDCKDGCQLGSCGNKEDNDYDELYKIEEGSELVINHKTDLNNVVATSGVLIKVLKGSDSVLLLDDNDDVVRIDFNNILSVQIVN